MNIPDFTADFCSSFRAIARVESPPKELDKLFASRGKTKRETLNYGHELKQQRGWIHFWVALERRPEGSADLALSMHTFTPSKDTKERRSRALRDLLGRISSLHLAEETVFNVSASFNFPKDQFKPTIHFPDPLALGMAGADAPSVRVAGLRFAFATGPLKSVIIDGDERGIFVSSSMSVTTPLNDQLVSRCFEQISALSRSVVAKNN